jgi:peptidoglycan/LPS O-acetylase OafA/YrhL
MNVQTPPSGSWPASAAVRPRRQGKIADIEVLRGISILFVIAFHVPHMLITWNIPVLTRLNANYFQTWCGVDLFLAISGFVIGRSLLPKLALAHTARDFGAQVIVFWVRRAWRLLPSAWLWLAIILVAAAFFNRSGAFGLFHDNFESTIAGVMSVANIRFGYVFLRSGYGASSVYWSLSLEEQFYFVLPFIVFFSRKRLVPVLLTIFCIFMLIPAGRYTGVFRVQPIILGVLIAEFSRQDLYAMAEPVFLASRWWLGTCVSIVFLVVLASLCPFGQHIAPDMQFTLIAITSAALVFLASYDRGYSWCQGWSKNGLMWFGSRSYALYLTHVPAFAATREIFFRFSPKGTVFGPAYTWPFLLLGLGLALALGEASYRLVETPMRRKGVLISKKLAAEYSVPAESA